MIKTVKNFLSKDELNLAVAYWHIKKSTLKPCPQVKNSFSDYSDTLGETILTQKQKLVEKHVGEKLLPTYTFTRMYKKGNVLEKHYDRPSCEVSVSINYYADKPWSLKYKKLQHERGPVDKKAKVVSVFTKPGDAVIYEGMQYEHWRDAYKGEECMQIFIHYVRANGKYKIFNRDGRVNHNEKTEDKFRRIWA